MRPQRHHCEEPQDPNSFFFSLSLSPTSPGKLFWIFSWAALGRSLAVSSIDCGIWLTLILSFSWNPSNECLNNALKRITNISLYTIRNNRFQGHATLAVDVAFFFFHEEVYYFVSLCVYCVAFTEMQAVHHKFYLFAKQINLSSTINSYMFRLKNQLLGYSCIRNNLMKAF